MLNDKQITNIKKKFQNCEIIHKSATIAGIFVRVMISTPNRPFNETEVIISESGVIQNTVGYSPDGMCMNNKIHVEDITVSDLRKKISAHKELFGGNTIIELVGDLSDHDRVIISSTNRLKRLDNRLIYTDGSVFSCNIGN